MISEFGQKAQFILQLVDRSNEIFNVGDLAALPTHLTREEFDPSDPAVISDTGTIGLLLTQRAPLMTVDSAYLRVVPIPGAWLLFVPGLLLLKRRSN